MSENKPIKKYRLGSVVATVWVNKIKKQVGKSEVITPIENVTIERLYRDKEGNWKATNSFRPNDLPKVAKVAEKAWEFLSLRQQKSNDEVSEHEEVLP